MDESEEIKGWVQIAREADVGTDDTARARSRDHELPLPVHHRRRRVFARRCEIEFWQVLVEYVTSARRMRAETLQLLETAADETLSAELREQLEELDAFESTVVRNGTHIARRA